MENLYSAAERRMLLNNEKQTCARILDLYGVIPAITGKVELVYEGEQEGPLKIAHILINNAIKAHFKDYFPNPSKMKKVEAFNPYQDVTDWFTSGNTLDLMLNTANPEFVKVLKGINGLEKVVKKYHPKTSPDEQILLMEFVLFGLAEYSFLSKLPMDSRLQFRDILNSMLSDTDEDDDSYSDLDSRSMY